MADSVALRPGTTAAVLPPPHPTIIAATDLGGVSVLKHGNLYLLSDALGDVYPDARGLGLYDLDTRVLSCAVLRVNGVRPTLLRGHVAANHTSVIQLLNPETRRDPAIKQYAADALAVRSLSITRRRWISGGLAERIEVTNFGEAAQDVIVELDLDFDAADIFEVRGKARTSRGEFRATQATDRSLRFAYEGRDGLLRRTLVTFDPGEVTAVGAEAMPDGGSVTAPAGIAPAITPGGDSAVGAPRQGSVRIRWALAIEPGASAEVRWQASSDLKLIPGLADRHEDIPTSLAQAVSSHEIQPESGGGVDPDGGVGDPQLAEASYGDWIERCARISSDGEILDLAVRRGVSDLRLLQNDGPRAGEHYLAAGVPWFTTLFGRDSIITSLQVLPFMPAVARDTLRVLADWQGREDDPTRDMEPGKILHELRTGEMARTGELPHRPYYGTADATPLWLVLLDETYRWTGDLDLVRALWPNALAALAWIDRYGDRDGDGFVEYERRTPEGLLNQGWKDSGDSVRHRDGSIAQGPIALVEIQGYVYDAKVRMASLARRLGEDQLADRLIAEAGTLRRKFDAAFWMPDRGFYSMALDGRKRQVGTITSNPGHSLWSGIVPPERVDSVVDRLLDPSLDSGWGIRTYAAGQPGYNPVGYHTGTVWPHDNAIIAAGMKRVGRHDAADRVASRIFEAARESDDFRLPELFCGFDRSVSDVPVPYPVACSPQAWAAATPLSLLQTMLGMRAQAADGVLELDRPHLPAWLGKVTVHDLQVADRRVDLLFHRWRGTTTSAEVLRRDGPLELVIRI